MDVGSSLNPAIDIGQVRIWGIRVVMDVAMVCPAASGVPSLMSTVISNQV